MNKLIIAGLGPGDPGLITLSAWEQIRQAQCLLLRTAIHPTVAYLREHNIAFNALDHFYEDGKTFEEVYDHIVSYVLDQCRSQDVVYVVPGSPVVAENTVTMLVERGQAAGVAVTVLPGMSFLEVLYTRLHLDPVNGVLILDSSDVASLPVDTTVPVVITQVYDKRVASDVKLSLMDLYGDEYEALLVHHISLPDEIVRPVKLYELDRIDTIDHLTSLVLPEPPQQRQQELTMEPLDQVMGQLLGEGGCLWDKAQTHATLRRYLLEEVYEMLDAIDDGDQEGMREELGDILYQIVFHCRLAEAEGLFTMDDVLQDISRKMVRRHPHVFQQKRVENIGDSVVNWDRLKQGEKRQQHAHIVDGVVKGLPSLLQSYKLQEKAAKVGFEWQQAKQFWDKLDEELQEFKEALGEHDADHAEEEAGDVLFVLVNLFRQYGIEPECALHRANSKFRRRFSFIEDQVSGSQREWRDFTLMELEAFWQGAKKMERNE